MASVNRATILGALGKDVELRHTASGQAVASFSVATSEKFKDKDGSYIDRTEWHAITLWGRLGEVAAEFLAKGKLVYIEGRIQTRKWQDKEGKDRYTTEIVGDKMQLLSPKSAGSDAGSGYQKPASQASSNPYHEEAPPDCDLDVPF